MDSDLWFARLAAKRQRHHLSHTLGSSHLDRFGKEGFEIEEDFPCPYCYEEFDLASLCSHLEDEHSFESKSTVCPICFVRITKDVLSHITMQHGHLFKLQRRRRIRKVPLLNNQALSLLGRDLREAHLQVLLGSNRPNSLTSSSNVAAADPFLSSLVFNFPGSESEEISKSLMSTIEDISKDESVASQQIRNHSLDLNLSSEEREKRTKEASVRAVFMQDLLISALFSD